MFNACLVNIRDFFQNVKKSDWPQTFEPYILQYQLIFLCSQILNNPNFGPQHAVIGTRIELNYLPKDLAWIYQGILLFLRSVECCHYQLLYPCIHYTNNKPHLYNLFPAVIHPLTCTKWLLVEKLLGTHLSQVQICYRDWLMEPNIEKRHSTHQSSLYVS